jgi:uncharacterized protein (DUF697 family)
MDAIDPVSLASFRILAAIARADGTVDDQERRVLEDALGSEHKGLLHSLLHDPIDVDAAIDALPDEATRARVYRSGFALAYVDDRMAHDEVAILEKVWPDHPEDSLLEEVLHEIKDTILPSGIMPVADPAKRAAEIEHDILKYAFMAAVVGATPIPVVGILADAAVVAFQLKMVRDIGLYWGHDMDNRAARSLIGTAAGGAGMQVALNNVARFVPGFGSVFAATTSFATTFAIGKVADRYFAGDRALSESDMKDLFRRTRAEGKVAYQERSAAIDQVRQTQAPEIEKLAKAAADKEISTRDFEERVMAAIEPDGSA